MSVKDNDRGWVEVNLWAKNWKGMLLNAFTRKAVPLSLIHNQEQQ